MASDIEFLLAQWVFEELHVENVPAVATEALAAGCASATLAVLAGLAPTRRSDVERYIPALLRELSVQMPTEDEAAKLVADAWLTRIVGDEVRPADGAQALDRLALLVDQRTSVWSQLSIFVGLWDIWQGDLAGRPVISDQIREEAQRMRGRGGLLIRGAFHVEWGIGEHAVIVTVAELDALLDAADPPARAAGRPQCVDITDLDGAGTLHITVGDERSLVGHIPANLDPPCLTSIGDVDEDRPFTFWVRGDHHSECAWGQTVPAAAAREAARVFVRERRLDDRVRWTEI